LSIGPLRSQVAIGLDGVLGTRPVVDRGVEQVELAEVGNAVDAQTVQRGPHLTGRCSPTAVDQSVNRKDIPAAIERDAESS